MHRLPSVRGVRSFQRDGQELKPFPKLNREFFGKVRCQQGQAHPHLVTYHGTQGSTARSGAITLTSRPDGSAHEVHDAKEGFKLAPDDAILCHVAGANTGNYGIEDATFANWIRKVWFLHRKTLKWSAYRVAAALRRNGIPNHFVDLDEANRAGGLIDLKGWTYHCVLSDTGWCQSTHQDPSPRASRGGLFPHKWFKRYVDFYFENPEINYPVKLKRDGKRRLKGKP